MDNATQEIVDKIRELNRIQDADWYNNTLFTWSWWVGVFLTIAPWILWILVRKKSCTYRLLFVGFFVMIFTAYLDFIGIEHTLWYYDHKVLPTIPAYIPWDFALFPVTIMILLQYKPKINPLVKAVGFAAFSAFIGEPFFQFLRLYTPITWKYIYSFPIYIFLYLVCHFLSKAKKFESL